MSIALAMIVRDEAKTLPACLERARPLIDTWTVVDTGSVDKTKQVVRRAMQGIPGELHEREWVSHEHNRTELLELARDSADYLLLVDADLLIDVEDELPELTHDLYVARLTGDFQHTLPVLVSTRRQWRYKGAAHAHLVADGPASISELPNVRLSETRSNSPRADKIARDAQALEREIDPRTVYYLAQSYADLGYDDAAADLFRFRVRHSAAHPQERAWACYREGVIRIGQDFNRGAAVLLEAWEMRPSRAEPLWKLAREHRLKGQPHVALMYAEQAVEIPQTRDDHFVLRWVYDWGCLMERALARQACGDRHGADEDFRTLSELPGEPGEFAREQLREAA